MGNKHVRAEWQHAPPTQLGFTFRVLLSVFLFPFCIRAEVKAFIKKKKSAMCGAFGIQSEI